TADNTVNQDRIQQRVGVFHHSSCPALESFDPGNQPVGDPGTYCGLRYVEHQENDHCESRNTNDLIGDHCVDLILQVLILCKDFSLLNFLYNAVDKIKTFSVCSLYCIFIVKIDISLDIRSLLPFPI